MSNIPEDLRYAPTHEWVRINDDKTATIGISDHAQGALGDIVFVELPEPGSKVNANDEVAVVESVKAASDIYSPISGEVISVNNDLVEAPETVNSSPYQNGWFFKMKVSDDTELQTLLDADGYSDHCEGE